MRALRRALLLLLAATVAAQGADSDYYSSSQHQNCVPLGSRMKVINCTREGDVAVCRATGISDPPTLRIGLRAARGKTSDADTAPTYCASLLAIERGGGPLCYERLTFRNFTVAWADDSHHDSSLDRKPVVVVHVLFRIAAMKQLTFDSSTSEFWDFTNSDFSAESGFLAAVTFNQGMVKPRPCHIPLANIYNLGGTIVEQFSLDFNEHSRRYPRFGPMPKLKDLRLVHCNIGNFPDDAHIQMPVLERLDLAKNWLTWIPAAIAGMEKLKMLNLSGTGYLRLTGHLPPLPQLSELTLEHTFFRSQHLEEDTFQGVPNLQVLDISHNNLASLGAALRGLHRLSRLDASNNQLTEYPELQLQAEASLNFAHNRLYTVPHCAQFGSSSRHLTLELQNNQIYFWDGGPNMLRCVDSLNLANNSLVSIGANMLASLESVKAVGLSNNPVHCGGCEFAQLQEWLQKTQVDVWAGSRHTGAATGLRCATPPAFRGMSVGAVAVSNTSDPCTTNATATATTAGSGHDDPLLVGLSLGAAFLALGVAAAVACYRYRFELAYSAHLLRLRARARSSRRKVGADDDDVFLFGASILHSGLDGGPPGAAAGGRAQLPRLPARAGSRQWRRQAQLLPLAGLQPPRHHRAVQELPQQQVVPMGDGPGEPPHAGPVAVRLRDPAGTGTAGTFVAAAAAALPDGDAHLPGVAPDGRRPVRGAGVPQAAAGARAPPLPHSLMPAVSSG